MLKNLLRNSQKYLKNLGDNLEKLPKPSFRYRFPKSLILPLRSAKNNLEETPNLAYIKELSNSDIDFQNKFLKTLSDEYASELNAYQFCIEMGAPRAAAVKVGKLKDKLNILGMKKAFRFAERHQRKLQKGNKRFDGKFKKILIKGNRFITSQLQMYDIVNQ